jgi:dipeptidase E
MNFYLSSFKLGDKSAELVRLMGKNKKIAYIPNACDYTKVDWDRRNTWEKQDMQSLKDLGLSVEYFDLKKYFGRTEQLREKLSEFGGVFLRGGNTFILRQAMKLSGFDIIFKELLKKDDFVYSGYSAGICVLAPGFKAIQQVDDPTDHPYPEQKETIWEGLGFLDYIILPHYKSDHPESADIYKEVEFAKKNMIPFKTLKDGEVIIIE